LDLFVVKKTLIGPILDPYKNATYAELVLIFETVTP